MVFVNEGVDLLRSIGKILSPRAGGALESPVLGQHVVVVEEHEGDLPRRPHVHQGLGVMVQLGAHPLAALQLLQAAWLVADVPKFGLFDTNPPALLVDRGHRQQVAQLSHSFSLAALRFGQQWVGEGGLVVDGHFFRQVSVESQLVFLFDEVGVGLEPGGICFVVFQDGRVVELLFVPAGHGRRAAGEGLGQGVLAVPPVGQRDWQGKEKVLITDNEPLG